MQPQGVIFEKLTKQKTFVCQRRDFDDYDLDVRLPTTKALQRTSALVKIDLRHNRITLVGDFVKEPWDC